MHVLVIVNPGASRAEIATEELSQWFSAHAAAIFVCATSIDDLKEALHEHGANEIASSSVVATARSQRRCLRCFD